MQLEQAGAVEGVDPKLRAGEDAVRRALIEQRMNARTGHYMPTSLIDSQLAALQPPDAEAENALWLSVALAPERISPMVAFLATDAAAKINGLTFGVEGNEIFAYRMLASHGVTRYQTTCWTIEDIEASLQEIIHW